jgi:hypothetical protein
MITQQAHWHSERIMTMDFARHGKPNSSGLLAAHAHAGGEGA